MKNALINQGGSITVGASKTAFPITNPFLSRSRDYFRAVVLLSSVVRGTGQTFKLQHSYDGNDWFDVGSEAQVATAAAKTAASASDINTTTNVITSTSHGFVTGDLIAFVAGTTAPGGMTTGTVYYCIKVDANTFKLATTQLDAFNGTVLDITSTGTGTQNFFPGKLEMRMVANDSSDYAQLPIYPMARIVVDTGASDSLVITKVYVDG